MGILYIPIILLGEKIGLSRSHTSTPIRGGAAALLEAVSEEVFQRTLREVFCPSAPPHTVQWPKAREVAENEGETP